MDEEIEIILKPHPYLMHTDEEIPNRYIRTTGKATVEHLSQYLVMRLIIDLSVKVALPARCKVIICLFINPRDLQLVIPGAGAHQTLQQLHDNYWKVNQPMELLYTWKFVEIL